MRRILKNIKGTQNLNRQIDYHHCVSHEYYMNLYILKCLKWLPSDKCH